TFHSILARCETKPPLYWMWMRLFTGSSLGGCARTSFGCRVGFVDLVELTRPHTGRECCPEVPRTTARVLAENPRDGKTAVCGAARGKETSVWISSIRTSGLRRSVVRRDQCAAKRWRQRENRRSLPRGVKPSVYPLAARRRVSP
ncbi:hypothetical protein TcCL_NonESM11005, partial [Trypanosoma cruzi]